MPRFPGVLYLPLPLRLSGGPLPGGHGLGGVIGVRVVLVSVVVCPPYDLFSLALVRNSRILPIPISWGADGIATGGAEVDVPRCNDFVVVVLLNGKRLEKISAIWVHLCFNLVPVHRDQIDDPNLMRLAPWDRMNRRPTAVTVGAHGLDVFLQAKRGESILRQ